MNKKEIVEKIRIVEIYQNSWAEENLVLLTTLNDVQITSVLDSLIEEEREDENGQVIYANEDMASILSEKYPNDIVVLNRYELLEHKPLTKF
jgi:hypothetical protein